MHFSTEIETKCLGNQAYLSRNLVVFKILAYIIGFSLHYQKCCQTTLWLNQKSAQLRSVSDSRNPTRIWNSEQLSLPDMCSR
jgi:hypothetical protein